MTEKQLQELGLSEEQIPKVLELKGKAIATFETENTTLTAKLEGLTTQLADANKQIETFGKMDFEGMKKAADDYKAAAKKSQEDADAKIAAMQFDYALERELTGAKARDPKVVTPLLKRDALKYADGSISGLKEQLEELTKSHDYLFDIEKPAEEDPAAQQPAQMPVGVSIFQPDGSKGAGSGHSDPFLAGFYGE